MDNVEMILKEPVSGPVGLEKIGSGAGDAEKRKFAANFESIFVQKILESMESTIGQWGLEEDSTSGQVRGIFQMYLAEHVAHSGGLGLAREIYNSLKTGEATGGQVKGMDERI